jgi:hypothetical protein
VLHGLVLLIARAVSGSNATVSARQQARLAAREGAGELALVEAAAASSVTQTLAIVLSMPLVAALAMLLGWHVYLVVNNKTTVEYHEGVRARRTAQVHRRGEGGTRCGHIYDVGVLANVQAALGQQVRCVAWRAGACCVEAVRAHVPDAACAVPAATGRAQPLYWLLPGCSADGDGLAFETTT